MKKMQFTIDIHANKERVWDTLWQDATFRDWSGLIDPGTYLIGHLKKGNEVQFISASGYGVTSLVEDCVENEFILFRHQMDTQENGKQERAAEWTGGEESYRLAENDDITTLTAMFDVPLQQEEYFTTNYPKALQRVKELAEEASY